MVDESGHGAVDVTGRCRRVGGYGGVPRARHVVAGKPGAIRGRVRGSHRRVSAVAVGGKHALILCGRYPGGSAAHCDRFRAE